MDGRIRSCAGLLYGCSVRPARVGPSRESAGRLEVVRSRSEDSSLDQAVDLVLNRVQGSSFRGTAHQP